MTKRSKEVKLPLIYSCSGCSNVAQLANDMAVEFNSEGIAEMSCIVGVGGNVKPLVRKARENRPIVVIDGCILQCAKACLSTIGIEPNEHIILTDHSLKKENNAKLPLEKEMHVYGEIKEIIKKM